MADETCGARFPGGMAHCGKTRGHRGAHATILGAWEWPRETGYDDAYAAVAPVACGAVDDSESCRFAEQHHGPHSWRFGEQVRPLAAAAAERARRRVEAGSAEARVETLDMARLAADSLVSMRDEVIAQVWASAARDPSAQRARESLVEHYAIRIAWDHRGGHPDAFVRACAAAVRAFVVACGVDLRETDDHTGDEMAELRRDGNRLRRVAAWIQGDELASPEVPAEPRIVLEAIDAADALIGLAGQAAYDAIDDETEAGRIMTCAEDAREHLLDVRVAWVATHKLEPSCADRYGYGDDPEASRAKISAEAAARNESGDDDE